VPSAEDRETLTWLRFHWGQEYAVNLQGSVWTAIPALDPELVLSEPTAARLRAAMYLACYLTSAVLLVSDSWS
jgi:hypothetical protein